MRFSTRNLARQETRDPFQWGRVTSDYSLERTPLQTELDQKRPAPRPKTAIGVVAPADTQFYSERYRRRNSATRCGFYTTPAATTISTRLVADDSTTQADKHRSSTKEENRRRSVGADNDENRIENGTSREGGASSAFVRPKTSQRRPSEVSVRNDADGRNAGGNYLTSQHAYQANTGHRNTQDVNVRNGRERKTSAGSSAGKSAARKLSHNGVTFTVPHDTETGAVIHAPTTTWHSEKFRTLKSRRMSAPELPPIVDYKGKPPGTRGEKRNSLISNPGTRPSLVHQTPIIKTKPSTSRLANTDHEVAKQPPANEMIGKKHKTLPRNSSEPILSGFLGNVSTLSQESISTNRSYSTRDADALSGSGSKQIKFLSNGNRALSWCATDNAGSQNKLETLFEGKVQQQVNNFDEAQGPTSPRTNLPSMPYVYNKASSTSSTNNIISIVSSANNVSYDDNNNNNGTNDFGPGDNRSRKDVSRLQSLNQTEATRGRIRRSNSENKLNGKSHAQDANSRKERTSLQQAMTRNSSVDRIVNPSTSPQRNQNKTFVRPRPAGHHLRRASSHSMLNNGNTFRDEDINHNHHHEDERDLLNQVRIEEWLNEVNSVDYYDTDPKDINFDYVDDVSQTDTAIHLVYEGD